MLRSLGFASIVCCFCLQLALTPRAYSQAEAPTGSEPEATTENKAGEAPANAAEPAKADPLEQDRQSYFTPRYNPDRPRSIWVPAFSLLIPGLDQWMEGQYGAAAAYTGIAVGSELAGAYHMKKLDEQLEKPDYKRLSDEAKDNREIFGETERRVTYAGQLRFAVGSFSVYHGFRTAVTTQKKYGRFTFLTKDETPLELMAAPFKFQYITRPSTYIPLAVIAFLYSANDPTVDNKYIKRQHNRSDYAYSSVISYTAGTHEELLFRGWLMPVLMDQFHSEFWSNATTSLIFALAHLGTTPLPLPQAILGYHLGWVTQRNNWTLSESIFIHTWWDVFAFLMQYQFQKKDPSAAAPTLWLPPFEMRF